MQQITGFLRLVFVLSLASFATLVSLISSNPHLFVLRHQYFIAHAVITAVLTLSLAAVFARWTFRVAVARRLQRVWSTQQRHALGTAACKAACMLAILVSDMVVTGSILSRPEYFCNMPAALTAAQVVRWTGWNTLVLALTLDSSAPLLWASTEGNVNGSSKLGSCDEAMRKSVAESRRRRMWIRQWPQALAWVVTEGAFVLTQ